MWWVVLTVLLDGLNLLLLAVASQHDDPNLATMLASFVLGESLGLLSALLLLRPTHLVLDHRMLFGACSSGCGTLANVAFVYLIRDDSVVISTVTSLLQFVVVLPIVVGLVAHGARLNRLQCVGMVVGLAALALLLAADEAEHPWTPFSMTAEQALVFGAVFVLSGLQDVFMSPSTRAPEQSESLLCGQLGATFVAWGAACLGWDMAWTARRAALYVAAAVLGMLKLAAFGKAEHAQRRGPERRPGQQHALAVPPPRCRRSRCRSSKAWASWGPWWRPRCASTASARLRTRRRISAFKSTFRRYVCLGVL